MEWDGAFNAESGRNERLANVCFSDNELNKWLFAVGFSFLERTFSKSVDVYFGKEMCNALCNFDQGIKNEAAYLRESTELYTFFEKLDDDNFDFLYKKTFLDYLVSSEKKHGSEEKKSGKAEGKSAKNYSREFLKKFAGSNIIHTSILTFMEKALGLAITNAANLSRNTAARVKPLLQKMEGEKLDAGESYELLFAVLAEILHCVIEVWRIEESAGVGEQKEENKVLYLMNSYGNDTIFRSHLSFLKIEIAGDKKLLLLYEEPLGLEMGLPLPKDDSLAKCKAARQLKVETDRYLDYCISRCTEALDKLQTAEDIDALIGEIGEYGKTLNKKLEDKDMKDLQRFIIDPDNLDAAPVKSEPVPIGDSEPVPIDNSEHECMICKTKEDLVKLGCGICHICRKDGAE